MRTFWIFSLVLLGMQCTSKQEKDEVKETPKEVGKLQIHFDNIVGNRDLVLGTESYQNALSQSFKVTTFNYYVSNIKLKRTNGSFYTLPQDSSYFLVRENILASQTLKLNGIPVDDYVGIHFTVGVDSLRSTMNIAKRTGVLDPATGAEGHYWTWNSGYIFMRLEGTSPQSTGTANLIQYHVGGFGGYSNPLDNNIKKNYLDFGTQKAQVTTQKTPTIHLKADALKVLSGAHTIDFNALPNVMSGVEAKKLAENLSHIFEFVEVK